jgi:hypothetical protein
MPLGRRSGATRDCFMYSHKGMLSAEGALTYDGVTNTFGPDSALAMMDDHRGYYPREIIWDWVTATGFDGQTPFGFNPTCNQGPVPDEHHENAVWIGDRFERLPPVTFVRQPGPRSDGPFATRTSRSTCSSR